MNRAARTPAFTLIDLLITIAVMGVCAMVAVSASSPGDRTRVLSAARMVASDLELTRELSVSTPADLAVFRMNSTGTGYWIARSSATETPILRTDGAPYTIEFGLGAHALLVGVTSTFTAGATSPPAGGMLTFDAFGRLRTPTTASILVSTPGTSVTVEVAPSTGDVSIK